MNELLLLTKNDIPFISAELTIHHPSLQEIGLIGEDVFFTGVQFLTLTKESLVDLSPEQAQLIKNFDIVIKLVQDSSVDARYNKTCAESLLTLLFPDYRIMFLPNMIAITKEGENHIINDKNFDEFQDILRTLFCLNQFSGGQQRDYNPANAHAKRIADKIAAGRAKIAKQKAQQNNGQKVTILQRYLSILAVGEQKDLNALSQYSVYQLFDEFNRFSLKEQSDFYLQAKMAGAKDLQEVDNWMKDIHSSSEYN